jgi:sec-independent protein translocase protein TatA
MALRLPELIVIFVVALLVFGPKRLPEMGAQIGKSINAFKKGMSELTDTSSTALSTTFQSEEITRLEARRLELEILERELALKKAEAELNASQGVSVSEYTYDPETTVEASYPHPETTMEANHDSAEAHDLTFEHVEETTIPATETEPLTKPLEPEAFSHVANETSSVPTHAE